MWFLRGKHAIKVVYHLHGQTDRFTVWEIGKQNPGLVLKFHSGIVFTICTNQFHFSKNGREGMKLVSKVTLKKWTTNFRLEHSLRKNRTALSDVRLLPEIIPGTTQIVVFHLLFNQIFRKLFVKGNLNQNLPIHEIAIEFFILDKFQKINNILC